MNAASSRMGAISVAVAVILLVAAWQAYISIEHIPRYVLPGPWTTFHAATSHLSLLAHKALVTLQGAVLGLAAATVLAVILALAVVRWPVAEHVIMTYALLVRTLPIVGVAPIITLVVGRGLATSVLCVMVITVFSLLIAVVQGFESVPSEISEMSALYRTPWHRRLRYTQLPVTVGHLLQGMRVAAPLAVLGSLLAEWLDGFPGVGTLMIRAGADQETDLLMAAGATAVVLSLLAYAVVEVAAHLGARAGYRVDELINA